MWDEISALWFTLQHIRLQFLALIKEFSNSARSAREVYTIVVQLCTESQVSTRKLILPLRAAKLPIASKNGLMLWLLQQSRPTRTVLILWCHTCFPFCLWKLEIYMSPCILGTQEHSRTYSVFLDYSSTSLEEEVGWHTRISSWLRVEQDKGQEGCKTSWKKRCLCLYLVPSAKENLLQIHLWGGPTLLLCLRHSSIAQRVVTMMSSMPRRFAWSLISSTPSSLQKSI